jgi:hypothetical protein
MDRQPPMTCKVRGGPLSFTIQLKIFSICPPQASVALTVYHTGMSWVFWVDVAVLGCTKMADDGSISIDRVCAMYWENPGPLYPASRLKAMAGPSITTKVSTVITISPTNTSAPVVAVAG